MVTQLNPDAWKIAMQLDIERMTGKVRGYVSTVALASILSLIKGTRPLHGLPILIKANLGTKDKLETTGNMLQCVPVRAGF